METIQVKVHISDDGVLRLEMPTQLRNVNTEVVIILQPLPETNEPKDPLGWPIGYFDETYGILADDPMERGDQGIFEIRENFE